MKERGRRNRTRGHCGGLWGGWQLSTGSDTQRGRVSSAAGPRCREERVQHPLSSRVPFSLSRHTQGSQQFAPNSEATPAESRGLTRDDGLSGALFFLPVSRQPSSGRPAFARVGILSIQMCSKPAWQPSCAAHACALYTRGDSWSPESAASALNRSGVRLPGGVHRPDSGGTDSSKGRGVSEKEAAGEGVEFG